MSQLGQNIYEARIALGWSQAAAATKLDVTATTWSRWECGVAVPPMSEETPTLQRIAELLGTTVSDLTRGD